jgi:hypothetical protein
VYLILSAVRLQLIQVTVQLCTIYTANSAQKDQDSEEEEEEAFQAFAFETFGGLHADALALLQRLQGLLNQALIAQEDVEGYFVIRRVSFIIAAAVGRQLAARRV